MAFGYSDPSRRPRPLGLVHLLAVEGALRRSSPCAGHRQAAPRRCQRRLIKWRRTEKDPGRLGVRHPPTISTRRRHVKVVCVGEERLSHGQFHSCFGQRLFPQRGDSARSRHLGDDTGNAKDERGRSVAGAQVSIPGYPNIAVTDAMGNFVLPAHAADGQIVRLRAQKNQLSVDISAPAGNTPVELTLRRH